MKIKCVLFDLDGTLLPMDTETFTRAYFKLLTKKMLAHGYEPNDIIDGVNAGVEAMHENDGSRPNVEVFWERFAGFVGEQVLDDKELFDEFYAVEFQRLSSSCGFTRKAKETVALCRELGYRVAVATEPIFPLSAMESRLRWAGVDPASVELITSYETSTRCKNSADFYRDAANRLGVAPEECAMVGNDVDEDMPAEALGMKVFLLTDCLINREDVELDRWPHGGFSSLQGWLRSLNEA